MTERLPLLISRLDEAKEGIHRFQQELHNPELAELLSHFRAWYAVGDADGRILLAPSKFIGYQGLDAERYRAVAPEINGRATESVLSRWFVRPDSATEDALLEELATLLSAFGKTPSKAARVSVLKSSLHPREGTDGSAVEPATPLDAMLVFYRMLSAEDQREFRRRITGEQPLPGTRSRP